MIDLPDWLGWLIIIGTSIISNIALYAFVIHTIKKELIKELMKGSYHGKKA